MVNWGLGLELQTPTPRYNLHGSRKDKQCLTIPPHRVVSGVGLVVPSDLCYQYVNLPIEVTTSGNVTVNFLFTDPRVELTFKLKRCNGAATDASIDATAAPGIQNVTEHQQESSGTTLREVVKQFTRSSTDTIYRYEHGLPSATYSLLLEGDPGTYLQLSNVNYTNTAEGGSYWCQACKEDDCTACAPGKTLSSVTTRDRYLLPQPSKNTTNLRLVPK
eukprot:sb/3469940/